MPVSRLTRDLFFDADMLVMARFENLDQENPTASLWFRGGNSTTVNGDAARVLYDFMDGDDIPDQGVAVASDPSPSGNLNSSAADRRSPVGITAIASLVGRKKAWFYRRDDDGHNYFLAFVNAKGSCSMRTWDAASGIFIGKQYQAGEWQQMFSDYLNGAIQLTLCAQPNLERDCNPRLPERVLSELRKQIANVGKNT